MTLLIAGVVLWMLPHFFKRLLPDVRAGMGDAGKGLVSILLLVSIVLMVIGYRSAEFVDVYTPFPGMGHLNNLLMLIAVFLSGAGQIKGRVVAMVRHPMLWSAVVWAAAHLLVNGDVASIILFGGIGFWAFAQMVLINRAEGGWDRPQPGPWSKDALNLVVSLAIYGLIVGIHIWLGYSPFLGTYG
jgi:uncharacterized membrane protein